MCHPYRRTHLKDLPTAQYDGSTDELGGVYIASEEREKKILAVAYYLL